MRELQSRQLVDPRIQKRDSRALVVTCIAGHDRQPVLQGCGRNDQVGLRARMAKLAPVFDKKAPLDHDILRNFKHVLFKHRPHSVKQPVTQFGATNRIADHFDAVANFGERDRVTNKSSSRWPAMKFRTRALGRGRRNSEITLVSSSQPLTT
ncbi:MAG: hypothetical protein U5L05_14980 [Rubrivivax sp.]|nr:hypothetical protein [Rubrivivax sp.]